jgi:hypothetical protein
MEKAELRARIISTLETFDFSMNQLARINEIINE